MSPDQMNLPAQSPTRMPAAFIGHGSPMNTLEQNRFTAAWRELGRAMPPPRAILAISAHWFIHGSAVTAMQTPPVIHDFYGFAKALFEFDYPAPGSPELASEIIELVKPVYVAQDLDSWGLDHGTWSVLAHMFPRANVPVVQLSIHGGESFDYHFDLGARLAPLRERGVFILGSGNVVHNLQRIDWRARDSAADWAEDFDETVKQIMTARPADLARAADHPAYGMAVPTPEHFLPIAYLAGLAHAAGEATQVLVDGGTMGSLTMTSFTLGCRVTGDANDSSQPAATIPDPRQVPPESTNI